MRPRSHRRPLRAVRLQRTTAMCLGLVAFLNCGDSASPSAQLDTRPAPTPEGWRATLCLDGGPRELRRLREATGLGGLLPESLEALVRPYVALPPGMAPKEGAPICGLVLEEGITLAYEVEPRSDRKLEPGGPRGASWLDREGPGAAALAGERLVVAESRALVERALPHLAFSLLATERQERIERGITLRVSGAQLVAWRNKLDAALDEALVQARGAIRAERTRHAEPPAYGDPEVVLDGLAGAARHTLALLPDLPGLEATLTRSEAASLSLRVRAHIEDETPLAEHLARWQSGSARLASLPAGTGLALYDGGRGDHAPAWAPLLGTLAGAPAGAGGGDTLAALGVSGAGRWLQLEGKAPAQRQALLGTDYVRRVGQALVGCEECIEIGSGGLWSATHEGDARISSPDSRRLLARLPERVDLALYLELGALSAWLADESRLGVAPAPALAWMRREDDALELTIVLAPNSLRRFGAFLE